MNEDNPVAEEAHMEYLKTLALNNPKSAPPAGSNAETTASVLNGIRILKTWIHTNQFDKEAAWVLLSDMERKVESLIFRGI